jgi:hypothetical protein
MEGGTGYSAKVPIARLKRHEKQNPPPSKPPRVRSETVNKAVGPYHTYFHRCC